MGFSELSFIGYEKISLKVFYSTCEKNLQSAKAAKMFHFFVQILKTFCK